MKQLRVLLAFVVVVVFAGLAFAGSAADDSLKILMDGNSRFASGKPLMKDISDAKRKDLCLGQKPFAIVLTCSDSRVPPEILFDQCLGDIFVVRVAGNVVDKIELGSIEYGAEHLNSPLLFILGHSKCGAVKATLGAKGEPEGNIGEIVKKIQPAADAAKKKGGSEDQILETAIQENVKNVYNDVIARQRAARHVVHALRRSIEAREPAPLGSEPPRAGRLLEQRSHRAARARKGIAQRDPAITIEQPHALVGSEPDRAVDPLGDGVHDVGRGGRHHLGCESDRAAGGRAGCSWFCCRFYGGYPGNAGSAHLY